MLEMILLVRRTWIWTAGICSFSWLPCAFTSTVLPHLSQSPWHPGLAHALIFCRGREHELFIHSEQLQDFAGLVASLFAALRHWVVVWIRKRHLASETWCWTTRRGWWHTTDFLIVARAVAIPVLTSNQQCEGEIHIFLVQIHKDISFIACTSLQNIQSLHDSGHPHPLACCCPSRAQSGWTHPSRWELPHHHSRQDMQESHHHNMCGLATDWRCRRRSIMHAAHFGASSSICSLHDGAAMGVQAQCKCLACTRSLQLGPLFQESTRSP